MADLLYNNLLNSFNSSPLSLPLNLSHHPTFSFISFTPLQRRFLHSTLLASHSSQFHIISRSEHADGSVSFKFGDAKEISQIEDDLDGGNGVELDRDDNDGSLAEQANVLKDDENDSIDEQFVVDSVGLTDFCGDSVEDEPKCYSTSTAKVTNSSDSVGDELKSDSNSTAVVEDLSDSSSTAGLEKLNDFVKDELKTDLNSTVQVENWRASAEHELKSGSNSTAQVRNDSNSTPEVESFSASTEDELKIDSISTTEVEDSTDFETLNSENKRVSNVVSTCDSSVEIMIEKGGELDEGSEKMGNGEKLECGGNESTIISDSNFNDQALNSAVSLEDEENLVEEDNKTIELMSKQEAGEILAEEDDHKAQLKAEPILKKEESTVELKLEAEPILEKEDEFTVEFMPKHLEGEPVLDEEPTAASIKVAVAGHPSIAKLDGEPLTHDISDAAPPAVEVSGIDSTETNFGCVETSTVASSMTPDAASSPDSSEVHGIITHSTAQLDDDNGDNLVAASPFTSGITSAEASLHSLKKVELGASSFSVSSAVASLTHSVEALTGGKDAYFVSDNWFGVADGVGQWSFGGVDIGLYAHELMQNCEKLLNSTVSGFTNVKELLKQSAAMTKSTGLARVITGHVANQVLHVANIGDSGFLIIRNGSIFKKSSPMVHEFNFPYAIGLGDDSVEDIEEYHIELEEGDVIVTATDGLFDNLYEQEIASLVSKAVETGMHIQDLAELLANKAQEVGMSESARSPFADAAQAAGHPGYTGGKFDHVTVIVSLVQKPSLV